MGSQQSKSTAEGHQSEDFNTSPPPGQTEPAGDLSKLQSVAATLLGRMKQDPKPLSEHEVAIIVSHLDQNAPALVTIKDSVQPYHAKDLGIGQICELAERPPSLAFAAAAEQFDELTQAEAFRFIKSDARIEQKLQHNHAWIQIAGIGRTFYHHQLYAAFWLLKHERGKRRGAIEGDLMGLGKTTIAFLYVLLNYMLTDNLKHIARYPDRHCRPTEVNGYQQKPDEKCPSWDQFGIDCACRDASVSHSLSSREGASLIFVPKGLLGSWIQEWNLFNIAAHSEIKLYIHHGDFPYNGIPHDELQHIELEPCIPAEGCTTILVEGCKTMVARSERAYTYVVLTTFESYYNRVACYGGRNMLKSSLKRKRFPSRDNLTDGYAWGRFIVDEAHQFSNPSTQAYGIMQSLLRNNWESPNFVAFTGTPMLRHGIKDMIPLVKLINKISPALSQDSRFKGFIQDRQLEKLVAVMTDMATHNKADDLDAGSHTIATDLGALLAAYCIRRHASSVQNGKPLAAIPPLLRYDVVCTTPELEVSSQELQKIRTILKQTGSEQLDAALQQQQEDVNSTYYIAPSELLDHVYMVRELATVPALAWLGQRRQYTWEYIERNGWHTNPTTSPFYAAIDELQASSGKLQALAEFIRAWEDCCTWDGQPEQLVIISEFPFICHIVICFLLKKQLTCEWLHANIHPKRRQDLTRVFQGEDLLDKRTPSQSPFRVIVGASRVIGQGMTLHRAHRLILMEPSRHAAVEDQNADRVHRLGSKTDKCFFYRLVNSEARVETDLITLHAQQREFKGQVEWWHPSQKHTMSNGLLNILWSWLW